MLKNLLHKITPKFIVSIYHYLLAFLANRLFGQPSNKLIVIGVTGTSGKSTTCELLWNILVDQGFQTGLASGIRFYDGRDSKDNHTKMTMVGRFKLQRLLKRMVKNNCRYAIIEVTSQGIAQWRHIGINFDVVCITNLWSEHDEAHGGFENYKKTKGKLFEALMSKPRKNIHGESIHKISVTNADDEHYHYFNSFNADEKISFSLKQSSDTILRAKNIRSLKTGSSFEIEDTKFRLNLMGKHNVVNSLTAITIAKALGIDLERSSTSLEKVTGIPGRLEFIDEGQDFMIVVDYAFEPKAMQKLYDVVSKIKHNRIIHVLGTTGGGRDSKRGSILGGMAADFADVVVATDEDPYDDDPMTLIQRVVTGAENHGKEKDKDLFIKEKRLDGIAKAISLAQKDDIILITGKGSEGSMVVKHGKRVPWDDRQVVREILKND